jgi:hypothetical protein
LEHTAGAIVAQRGELPDSEPAAGANGDQQLGSVVQILPDLADAPLDHHQKNQSFSQILEQFACLWTRTCLLPKKSRFLGELTGCASPREVTDCPCVASRMARCS